MILFVSGRTDIPAYYSKWLFHRFDEGFVDTGTLLIAVL